MTSIDYATLGMLREAHQQVGKQVGISYSGLGWREVYHSGVSIHSPLHDRCPLKLELIGFKLSKGQLE